MHRILAENLALDYYCFLEDDLILNDPLFFEKLKYFDSLMGSNTFYSLIVTNSPLFLIL